MVRGTALIAARPAHSAEQYASSAVATIERAGTIRSHSGHWPASGRRKIGSTGLHPGQHVHV